MVQQNSGNIENIDDKLELTVVEELDSIFCVSCNPITFTISIFRFMWD